MSERRPGLVPDGSASRKLSEEDKYEGRTETDSGFLSGGNLLVSGEIGPEEADGTAEKAPTYMHIDSGVDVCLSETFSGLSLKHPDLNDLNATTKGAIKETNIKQQPKTEEQPWQLYFEQDEDGDT